MQTRIIEPWNTRDLFVQDNRCSASLFGRSYRHQFLRISDHVPRTTSILAFMNLGRRLGVGLVVVLEWSTLTLEVVRYGCVYTLN